MRAWFLPATVLVALVAVVAIPALLAIGVIR